MTPYNVECNAVYMFRWVAMQSPSPQMAGIGWTLRTLLLAHCSPPVLRDHKTSNRMYWRSASGTELVDWILTLTPSIHTRQQAAGMWQALLEEGVISHGKLRDQFI
jgi:Rap guanine nucleotide exchange factor 4